MDRGFVKLWRKSLDSRIFKNPELWQLWTWCLLKANHKPQFVEIVTGKGRSSVLVNTGSFVFGRNQAAKEIGQKPSGLWTRCLLLQRLGNLNIQSNTHYSIISIVNWEIYQPLTEKIDRQDDNQLTGNRQPNDTNKNEKNEKKKEKDFCPSGEGQHAHNFYLTRKKRKLEGKRLESFSAFWEAWNTSTPWGKAKSDAADAWLDIPALTTALVAQICEAAKDMGRNRKIPTSDRDSTPIFPATWIRARRWEDYDPSYKPTPKEIYKDDGSDFRADNERFERLAREAEAKKQAETEEGKEASAKILADIRAKLARSLALEKEQEAAKLAAQGARQ